MVVVEVEARNKVTTIMIVRDQELGQLSSRHVTRVRMLILAARQEAGLVPGHRPGVSPGVLVVTSHVTGPSQDQSLETGIDLHQEGGEAPTPTLLGQQHQVLIKANKRSVSRVIESVKEMGNVNIFLSPSKQTASVHCVSVGDTAPVTSVLISS